MARKKKRKAKKTAKPANEENIINMEMQREVRRQKLRVEADALRKKRGAKSIQEQMMEEVAVSNMITEGYTNPDVSDIRQTAESIKKKKGVKVKKHKKPITAQKKMAMIVLTIVAVMTAYSIWNILSLKIQEREARSEIELLKQRKAELTQQAAELGSNAYVEQQARNWLKMAKHGEIVYVLEKGKKEE